MQHESALKALDSYIDNQKRMANLDGDLAGATRRLDEAISRRDAAELAISAADAAIAEAEHDEDAARSKIKQIERATRARAARASLEGLEQRLNDALVLRNEIETARASQALNVIPDDAIEELERLELEMVRLQAVRAAGRPSVRVTYDLDGDDAVSMSGSALQQGDEKYFDQQAILSVRGVGSIMVRAGAPMVDAQTAEDVETRRRTLMKALGIETLAGARARQISAAEGEVKLLGLIGKLADLVPEGLAKLQEEVAARREDIIEIFDTADDEDSVRVALDAVEVRLKEARNARREGEPSRMSASNAVMEAEVAIAKISMARAQAEAVLGPLDGRTARASELKQAAVTAEAELVSRRRDLADLRDLATDLESVEAAWRRAQSADKAAATEIAQLQAEIAGLTGEIRASAEEAVEEKWLETCEALEAATLRAAGLAREVEILKALEVALEASRGAARDVYLQPVMSELKPLLQLLFEDAHIEFDDKTLLPQSIVRNGLEEDVDRLSGGMREQLSILTRLAFARLLAKDGRPVPIILDDALIYSDDDRIERMFDALHRQATTQQIIVFSCRQRAFTTLGGQPLRMTEWAPS
jgi:DNA repair exonuclease SbcCD ATPase subunit